MVKTRKLLAGLPIAAALALAVPAGAQDMIKVGAVGPLSSPGSYQQGKELVLGLQWAVDDMNAKGGLSARRSR